MRSGGIAESPFCAESWRGGGGVSEGGIILMHVVSCSSSSRSSWYNLAFTTVFISVLHSN